MKTKLQSLLAAAIAELRDPDGLALSGEIAIPVERGRRAGQGDFASPVALVLARPVGGQPRRIAERIVAALPASDLLERVEIAGPGFINFYLSEAAKQGVVLEILEHGSSYGRSRIGAARKVQVEFVSANPTGPLHVGHGRGAAYGAAVADLLAVAGFDVQREYYVNDAGRQMDILAVSVWLRYLESCGETVDFPANGYRGDYVRVLAARLRETHADALRVAGAVALAELPPDEPRGGDKEKYIDALIARARELLGADAYRALHDHARHSEVEEIRADLAEFGVTFDRWYSEREMRESGAIERTIERLRAAGHAYESEGAVWFRAAAFGDEKDRVLIRENGEPTYFAPDLAYHMEKFSRGFERVIDVWGADHHGYVARIKGGLAALGQDPDRFEALLVQFANLYRHGEKVSMSTRSGEFVSLRELREEVGNDAARFFYVLRRCEQHLDFDLDLAKSQSSDNPVYYVQYAHARITSVMRQAGERGMAYDGGTVAANTLARLGEPHEQALLATLSRYPETVEAAALALEPHQIAFYLRDLANHFHTYYNAHIFLVEDAELRGARLALIAATRQVLVNGLTLLGVSAPEAM